MGGNLTLDDTPTLNPYYGFAWPKYNEYLALTTYGQISIVFSISEENLIEGRYRYIRIRYWSAKQGQQYDWDTIEFKIQVEDLDISGDDYVCLTNKIFSVTPSVPSGYSASWSFYPSNLVTPASGSGSSATFKGVSCSLNDEGTLTYTLSKSGCPTFELEKEIVIVGPLVDLDVKYAATGDPAPYIAGYFRLCPYTHYHVYAVNTTNCVTSDYDWTYPAAWSLNYQYNNMISIYTNSTPGGQIRVTAETCCTVCDDVQILVDYVDEYWDCGRGGGYLIAVPNPADSYIDIKIDEELLSAANEEIKGVSVLMMYDKMGTVKHTAEFREYPYRINTFNLTEGLYIIQIINNGRAQSLEVVVEH